tara:strand:+ start:214 stop:408 length:195 start_codon:yes stop_codon:yes gene_type:complete
MGVDVDSAPDESSPLLLLPITPDAILEEMQHILSKPTPASIGTALAMFVTLIKEKNRLYTNGCM